MQVFCLWYDRFRVLSDGSANAHQNRWAQINTYQKFYIHMYLVQQIFLSPIQLLSIRYDSLNDLMHTFRMFSPSCEYLLRVYVPSVVPPCVFLHRGYSWPCVNYSVCPFHHVYVSTYVCSPIRIFFLFVLYIIKLYFFLSIFRSFFWGGVSLCQLSRLPPQTSQSSWKIDGRTTHGRVLVRKE